MFCLGVVFFSYLHPGMPSCDRVASVVVHSSASAFPKQTNYAGKYLLYVKTGGSTDSQLVHPADFTRVKAEMDGWRCKKDIRVKHPEFIEQGEQWLCLTPTLLNRMTYNGTISSDCMQLLTSQTFRACHEPFDVTQPIAFVTECTSQEKLAVGYPLQQLAFVRKD